jgi:hypothetical protein
MKAKDIQSGGVYVNKTELLVRVIIAVRNDGYVEYQSYWLKDGAPEGLPSSCQRQSLANWAGREATPEERAQLKRSDVKRHLDDIAAEILAGLSAVMPDLQTRGAVHGESEADFTIRDEANALVAWAFRNGPLENLHAGKYSPLLDDPSVSRITDDEMKELMINACRQLAKLLELKATDPAEYEGQIRSYNNRYCRGWER